MQGSVAVHKSIATAPVDSIYKDSIRWSGLQVQTNIQTSALPQKRGDKQKGAPHERTEQTRIPHP